MNKNDLNLLLASVSGGLDLILKQLPEDMGESLFLDNASGVDWPVSISTANKARQLVFRPSEMGSDNRAWEPFEDIGPASPGVDALILPESLLLLDNIYLLNGAFDLLNSGGTLFIFNPFSLVRTKMEIDVFPLLRHIVNQAKRCGFDSDDPVDMTKAVTALLRSKIQEIQVSDEKSQGKAGLSDKVLIERQRFVSQCLEAFDTGHRGYFCLKFTKREKPPKYRLAIADERSKKDFRTLFEAVFGHAMSDEWYQWKYGRNRGRSVIVYRGQKIVGHYGGVGRQVILHGKPTRAIQPVDVMVLPTDRYPKGPFYLASTTFLEYYMGYGVRYPFGFGFPNHRAMRLGKALKVYDEVDQISEIRWVQEVAPRFSFLKMDRIDRVPGIDNIIDALWGQMRVDLAQGIIGVRDARFLRHRYVNHPEITYDILVVRTRFLNSPLGLLVLKREERQCMLMDLVCPLCRVPLMIQMARRQIERWGIEELYTWITKSKASHFDHHGARINPLDVFVPGNAWTEGPSSESLQDNWWLMPGDTDFL